MPTLIEETSDYQTDRYRLTQIHDLDGHTVRIRVHRDFYREHSWALAEVLTPALAWTELVETPAAHWYPAIPQPDHAPAKRDCLQYVAEDLAERAQRVLRNTPPPPHGNTTPQPQPTHGGHRRPGDRHRSRPTAPPVT